MEERKVTVVEELKEEIQRFQERRGRQQQQQQEEEEVEERSREFAAVKREMERLQSVKEERETNLQVSCYLQTVMWLITRCEWRAVGRAAPQYSVFTHVGEFCCMPPVMSLCGSGALWVM